MYRQCSLRDLGQGVGLAVPTGMEGRWHVLGWGHFTAEKKQQPLQQQRAGNMQAGKAKQGKRGSAVTKETGVTAAAQSDDTSQGCGTREGCKERDNSRYSISP